MKAVLMSIQPKWCEKIANGAKTIEVRKSRPKLQTPFKVYIYCTNDRKVFLDSDCNNKFWTEKNYGGKHYYNGKVIGEFVCNRIYTAIPDYHPPMAKFFNYDFYNDRGERLQDCLTSGELSRYGDGEPLYAWHITDLKIYDKPKELSEFYLQCEEYGKTGTVDIPKKCKKCRYQYTWNLASKCRIDGLKPITKPPQSWCYVEELQNG